MNVNQDTLQVPVVVSKGMFDSECAVEITQADGKRVSLFVDCASIQDTDGRKFIELPVSSRSKGLASVLLPTEAFETLSRWAIVPTTA